MRVQALRPTLFIGVPRVFDKVYDGVYAKLKLASFYQRLIFKLALWHKERHINLGYRWDTVCVVPHTLIEATDEPLMSWLEALNFVS